MRLPSGRSSRRLSPGALRVHRQAQAAPRAPQAPRPASTPRRRTVAEEESREPPWSPMEESHEPPWSPWLRLMVAEIIRKREEREQAHAEQLRREAEEGTGAHD